MKTQINNGRNTINIRKARKIIWGLAIFSLFLSFLSLTNFKDNTVASIFFIFSYFFGFLAYALTFIFSKSLFARILGVTSLVILTSPLIIYSIVLIVQVSQRSQGSLPIPVADAKTWIGFAGSVIGGSMVMIALLFTLHNDAENRKSEEYQSDLDRSLSALPYIGLKDFELELCLFDDLQKYDLSNKFLTGYFILKNKSQYLARNICISDEKSYIRFYYYDENDQELDFYYAKHLDGIYVLKDFSNDLWVNGEFTARFDEISPLFTNTLNKEIVDNMILEVCIAIEYYDAFKRINVLSEIKLHHFSFSLNEIEILTLDNCSENIGESISLRRKGETGQLEDI